MKIEQWLIENQRALEQAGIETPRLDCLVLLESTLHTDRAHLLAHIDEELTTEHIHELAALIERRVAHEPIAYLRGTAEFYGREFSVNHDVLVPRPESESLIDLLKEYAREHDIDTVIDIGTGSGCLAITAKHEFPGIHVTGVDTDAAALTVARHNGRTHGVRVQWKQRDIREGLPAMPRTRPYVLLANLPYVPDAFPVNRATTYEPPQALFAGKDGLDFYRVLFAHAASAATKPTAIITEALESQHAELSDIATNHGYVLDHTQGLGQCFVAPCHSGLPSGIS